LKVEEYGLDGEPIMWDCHECGGDGTLREVVYIWFDNLCQHVLSLCKEKCYPALKSMIFADLNSRKIIDKLLDLRRRRMQQVAIHELMRMMEMPAEDFREAFWKLSGENKIILYRSNRMTFWKVTDLEWESGEKYYAHSKGIRDSDWRNMVTLYEGRDGDGDYYFVELTDGIVNKIIAEKIRLKKN
jgi:hypothetical protein